MTHTDRRSSSYHVADLPQSLLAELHRGMVIPAMPLALNEERRFLPAHQTALARYYIDAGAGGIAVGVHSTQFEIRHPDVALFEPVLSHTSAAIDEWCAHRGRRILKIAGVCGATEQALAEARFALSHGYDAALLSLAALAETSIDAALQHCRRIAEVLPLVGFYLQPAVGGRVLPCEFWRAFAAIDNVLAIKIAPFHRYRTHDVVRAVCEAGREKDIALYTGNDDNIVADLLTPYPIATDRGMVTTTIRGGLLGHWCVWTQQAVHLMETIRAVRDAGDSVPLELLALGVQITDANAAFFDVAHNFAGCLPGIHEVLRRQGLLPGVWCLNPAEVLSPGQAGEIDRVLAAYPHLNDDAFVTSHIDEWFSIL